MTDESTELRFDRASYAKSESTGVPCAKCKGPIGEQYWKWQKQVVCGNCRDQISAFLASAQSPARFAKALLLGAATSLGCGIAYAIFVAATKMQFALVTIGIAFVIARVLRQASGGIGGRRVQVAAVAFTYFAATMGYAPAIWHALEKSSGTHHAKGPAAESAGAPEATPAAPDDGASHHGKSSLGAVLFAIAWLIGVMLSAPFLEATEAPLGLVIVGFGLWEAWKLSRGPPVLIEGPFSVAAPVASAPTAP